MALESKGKGYIVTGKLWEVALCQSYIKSIKKTTKKEEEMKNERRKKKRKKVMKFEQQCQLDR